MKDDYEAKLLAVAEEAKATGKKPTDIVEKPSILTENALLSPEEKVLLEQQVEKLSLVEKPIEYPPKVADQSKHHVIVLGHPGAGKTAAIKYIASEHAVIQ